jgi:hypothetical protein
MFQNSALQIIGHASIQYRIVSIGHNVNAVLFIGHNWFNVIVSRRFFGGEAIFRQRGNC